MAVTKMEEMILQLAGVRANVRQTFEILAKFKSQEDGGKQIKNNVTNIVEGLKKLSESGKKIEAIYKLRKIGSVNDEKLFSHANMDSNWREVRDRSNHAVNYFETQLRSRFPSLPIQPSAKYRKIMGESSEEAQLSFDKFSIEGIRYQLDIEKIVETTPSQQIKTIGLKIVCRGIFQAWLSLTPNSQQMDTITIYGIKEKKEGFWDSSDLWVFQKISEHAKDAVKYYMTNYPDSDYRRLIIWLSSYHKLFVDKCKGCGKLLHFDTMKHVHLPPCYRTFDIGLAYHPSCFNVVSKSS